VKDYNVVMAANDSSPDSKADASNDTSRSPLGLCAMCFTRKPLPQGWAWLKLCAECAAQYGQRAAPADATRTTSATSATSALGVSQPLGTTVRPAAPTAPALAPGDSPER
jgi:hypothetical protein